MGRRESVVTKSEREPCRGRGIRPLPQLPSLDAHLPERDGVKVVIWGGERGVTVTNRVCLVG